MTARAAPVDPVALAVCERQRYLGFVASYRFPNCPLDCAGCRRVSQIIESFSLSYDLAVAARHTYRWPSWIEGQAALIEQRQAR